MEKKHKWQTVSHKRKRISWQKSAETSEQIHRANRYESLSRTHCDDDDDDDDDTSGNVPATDTANKGEDEPEPPTSLHRL
jgi:hypothetical protein